MEEPKKSTSKDSLMDIEEENNLIYANSRNGYDLESLGQACSIELLRLLSQCLNLWHQSFVEKADSPQNRLFSYQLLLKKMQDYHPTATLAHVRNIIRQFKLNFGNESYAMATWHNNEQMRNRLVKESQFLRSTEKSLEMLSVDTKCCFCCQPFKTVCHLWEHMVISHLPPKNSSSQTNVSKASKSRQSKRRRLSRHAPHVSPSSSVHLNRNIEHKSSTCALTEQPKLFPQNKQRSLFDGCTFSIHSGTTTQTNRTFDSLISTPNQKTTETFQRFLAEFSDEFLLEMINVYKMTRCLWDRNESSFKKVNLRTAGYAALAQTYKQFTAQPVRISKVKQLIRELNKYYRYSKRNYVDMQRNNIWQTLRFLEEGRLIQDAENTNEFPCVLCPKTYKYEQYYVVHLLKQHPTTTCQRCKILFGNADDLKDHLLTVHETEIKCPMCDYSQYDWQSFLHMGEHFFFNTCPECSELFVDMRNFKSHKRECCYKNRFQCRSCGANFSKAVDFRDHAMQIHQNSTPFHCPFCPMEFSILSEFNLHKKVHNFMTPHF